MVSIHQMRYTEEPSKLNILADSYYKGYRYVILDRHGSHPCAYVEIPPEHHCYGKTDRDVWWLDIQEITYGRNYLEDIITDSWVIGWDYGHSSDRTRCDPYGKTHHTFNILEDVIKVINDLVDIEKLQR